METLELEMPKTKYVDLNQYETIPALDRALAQPSIGPFNSVEELFEHIYATWDEDD